MKAFDSLDGAVSVSQRAVYRGLALFPVLDFRKELFGHTFNVSYMAQTLWVFHQHVLIYGTKTVPRPKCYYVTRKNNTGD